MTDTIEDLRHRFGHGAVRMGIHAGRGGFTTLKVVNDAASAEICLHGGQVLDYRHRNDTEGLLFLSQRAFFEAGRAIKGGIPVCWPWFGDDPDQAGRGAHGFVRTREWSVESVTETNSSHTRITLSIADDAQTRALWPHRFRLVLEILVGPELVLELTTYNTDSTPFAITQALHTYFAVADISQTRVEGLDGLSYLDKPSGFARRTQQGEVRFDGEVDRIYQAVNAPITIADAAAARRCRIAAGGSHTAVVWNPGAAGAAAMADLDDDAHRRFVCVETANAADEVVTVDAGASHSLAARYSWRPLA